MIMLQAWVRITFTYLIYFKSYISSKKKILQLETINDVMQKIGSSELFDLYTIILPMQGEILIP